VRALLLLLCCLALSVQALSDTPTVGIEGQLTVLLPARDLRARPIDRTSPLTVRIASTLPRGELAQYDLRFIGLVPGKYDLRKLLIHQDGSPAQSLPPLPVEISGLLLETHNGHLGEHAVERPGIAAYYRWIMGGTALLWLGAAVPLFLSRRRRTAAEPPAVTRLPTLAERLQPLVEEARAGQLTTDRQAELERLLLGYWQQRLELGSLKIGEAMSRLRAHPEAGALLRALEDWLHRRPGTAKVDLDTMLAPYQAAELPSPPDRESALANATP
jgi:hypothetical protein